MAQALGALAILAAVIGFFTLSQATMGVGILAAACLLGIFARLKQAADHHQEVMKAIRKLQPAEQPPSVIGPTAKP